MSEAPRLHLPLAPTGARPTFRRAWGKRAVVVALAAAAAGLFLTSYFQPWWRFQLYAPQYPKGLELVIALNQVTGDVREINTLNHYIGMESLDHAAPFEREIAIYAVTGLAVVVLLASLGLGRKTGKFLIIPGIVFPLAFIGDSFYWLYSFGHAMNPKAPIHIAPFTPQLFGNGEIGQFMTFAYPLSGFWLAVGGAVTVVVAVLFRARVCKQCGQADTCRAVCRAGFIGPKAGLPREA
jgi:copper chaperone NosL